MITTNAIALIKQFEGFQPGWYWDTKHYAIGYGTSEPVVRELTGNDRTTIDHVDEATASELLRMHLVKASSQYFADSTRTSSHVTTMHSHHSSTTSARATGSLPHYAHSS